MRFLMSFLFTLISVLTVTPALAGSMAGNELKMMEYTYDFAVDGGAVGNIDLSKKLPLPVGSLILRGGYYVKTAPTSSGAATIALGNAAGAGNYLTATGYSQSNFAADSVALFVSGAPDHVSVANEGKPSITIGTAALTAGKIKVWFETLVPSSK